MGYAPWDPECSRDNRDKTTGKGMFLSVKNGLIYPFICKPPLALDTAKIRELQSTAAIHPVESQSSTLESPRLSVASPPDPGLKSAVLNDPW